MVLLAKTWWGLEPDEFITKARLRRGDYSRGPHPMQKDVVVIMPRKGLWEPADLPPLSFEFRQGKGLTEISGFLKKPQSEVTAAMIARYGKYSREGRALEFVTYGWELDGSVLEVAYNLFRLFPKRP